MIRLDATQTVENPRGEQGCGLKGKGTSFFFFGSDSAGQRLIPKGAEAQPAELVQTDNRSPGQLRGRPSGMLPSPTGRPV